MTRTRKVRRNIISEKFADLIAGLYDGSTTVSTETEVTYEDGRKGVIKATLTLADVPVVASPDLRAAA
jgi:long-chain acyl-CoA synthetase